MFKIKITIFSVLIFSLTETLSGQDNRAVKTSRQDDGGDYFPNESVWFNTMGAVNLNTLRDKMTIVMISDMNCIECGYYAKMLETMTDQVMPVQLIQVILPENNEAYTRNRINNFIQQNAYSFPIVVLPDLSGFQSSEINHFPHFLVYDKSSVPTISAEGDTGYRLVLDKINQLKESKELAATYSSYRIIPKVAYKDWANPLIETPTYLSAEEYGDGFYVNDLAHHRIVKFDKNGNCVGVFGSSIVPGFNKTDEEGVRLNHAGGMAAHNGKLYVADTYNLRLREIDVDNNTATTIIGNGNMDSLALPTDVEVWKKKMYVTDAFYNQIRMVDAAKRTSVVFANLPGKYDGMNRAYPINLAAGKKGLYVVMSNGEIIFFDKKGKMTNIPGVANVKFSAVCEWKGGLAACSPDKNAVYFRKKDNWELLSGEEAQTGTSIMRRPFDLTVVGGELFISDTDNHLIRTIHSTDEKDVQSFKTNLSEELISYEPSHTFGQTIAMDTIFIAKDAIAVKLKLDIKGFHILEGGQNYAVMHEAPAIGELLGEKITKDEIAFTVHPNREEESLYLEIYLTLAEDARPDVAIIKRAYLLFDIERTFKADSIQEKTYHPDLIPY